MDADSKPEVYIHHPLRLEKSEGDEWKVMDADDQVLAVSRVEFHAAVIVADVNKVYSDGERWLNGFLKNSVE